MLEKLMDVDEVTEALGVHRTTLYRLLKKKKLAGIRVGSDWRFQRQQIEAYLVRQTTPIEA